MSVVAPPPVTPPSPDELEALIREARARQRRRQILIAAGVLALAGLGLALWAAIPGANSAGRQSSSPSGASSQQGQLTGRSVPISWFGTKNGTTWAVANHSAWLTANGGRTWQRLRVPHVSGYWTVPDMTFVDPLHGWVVASRHGRDELVRTTDGGRTWTASSIPDIPAGFASLSFSTPRQGYLVLAVHSGARLLETTDGGASWTRVSRAPFQWGSSVAVKGRDMWVLGGSLAEPGPGEGGLLSQSRNRGRTWRRVRLPHVDAVRYFASVGGTLIAAANVGRMGDLGVYVSTDRGMDWTLRTPHPSMPMGMAQFPFSAPSTDTWFAANGGSVLASSDAGRHWRAVFTTPHPRGVAYITEIGFSSPRIGWALLGSTLIRTTDGGRHWTPAGPRVPRHKRAKR